MKTIVSAIAYFSAFCFFIWGVSQVFDLKSQESEIMCLATGLMIFAEIIIPAWEQGIIDHNLKVERTIDEEHQKLVDQNKDQNDGLS